MRRTLASLVVAVAMVGGLAPAAHASCPMKITVPGTDKSIYLALIC